MKALLVAGAAVAALAFSATAGAQAENVRIPFDTVVVDCGDRVHVSGTVLGTFVFTETPSGGATLVAKFNPQGVSGVSLRTGAMYRAVGVTTSTDVFSAGAAITTTFVNRFYMIGTAGSPKILFSETVHITFNRFTGTITADVEKFSDRCLG